MDSHIVQWLSSLLERLVTLNIASKWGNKCFRLGICSVPHTNPLNNHFMREEEKHLIGKKNFFWMRWICHEVLSGRPDSSTCYKGQGFGECRWPSLGESSSLSPFINVVVVIILTAVIIFLREIIDLCCHSFNSHSHISLGNRWLHKVVGYCPWWHHPPPSWYQNHHQCRNDH